MVAAPEVPASATQHLRVSEWERATGEALPEASQALSEALPEALQAWLTSAHASVALISGSGLG